MLLRISYSRHFEDHSSSAVTVNFPFSPHRAYCGQALWKGVYLRGVLLERGLNKFLKHEKVFYSDKIHIFKESLSIISVCSKYKAVSSAKREKLNILDELGKSFM